MVSPTAVPEPRADTPFERHCADTAGSLRTRTDGTFLCVYADGSVCAEDVFEANACVDDAFVGGVFEASTAESPLTNAINWTAAIEMINAGRVIGLYQTSDGVITLTLDDESTVQTAEPSADAIYDELEQCGDVCASIFVISDS